MKQQKGFLFAYAAGVIDSDGSIILYKSQLKSFNPSYQLVVKVSQGDGRCINLLQGIFGGNIRYEYNCGATKKRTMNTWELKGDTALFCLKRIFPFLRYKKLQAELGIRFQERLEKAKRNMRGQFTPVPKHELERRQKLVDRMKAEKKKFILATVTTKRTDPWLKRYHGKR